ncbi:MAG: Abi family protein [Rickettsiales bacterium]|jgi:hypothetical protein|nr:Abi family protein [Rickettsiales bacterium]
MNTEILNKYLSQSRIAPYVDIAGFNRAADLYKLNILLSEQLFSLLACFEVIFRNSAHNKLSEAFGENYFFELDAIFKSIIPPDESSRNHGSVLLEEAFYKVQRSIFGAYFTNDEFERLARKNNRNITEQMLCQLSFGFWVHLLDNIYAQKLWDKHLYLIFPIGVNRNALSRKLNSILRYRNRIAHCEPIIKKPARLKTIRDDLVAVMHWLSPEITDWALSFNSFDAHYGELVKIVEE